MTKSLKQKMLQSFPIKDRLGEENKITGRAEFASE
jgi:hypothetical protein